jgi:hypothetical protein
MATHDIFMGGDGPAGGAGAGTYTGQFFPAVPPGVDDYNRIDARRTPVTGGITRRLVWDRPRGPSANSPYDPTSPALAKYLEVHPIEQDDFLRIILLPRRCELKRVWWSVEKPLTGLEFTLEVEGRAASLGGNPVMLTAAPIDGGAEATGLIDVQAINGGDPLYIDGNDFLQMRLTGLPAAGIKGSDIRITAIIDQFEFGGN